MSAILIPVKDSAEVIEVQVEELPDDADELVSILAQEVAPLDTWLRVAIEYYKQGRSEQFKKILEPLTELDEGFFAEAYGQTGWKAHFIAVLNSLAAFYMAQATREREKAKRKAAFEQATSTYAMAEKEALKSNTPDIMYQTFTGQAQLTLTKGDVAKAVEMWGAITGPASTSVASTLGRACAQFQLGKPEEALKLYVELFKANPSPPPAVRLGLAFSGAKLAKPLLARKALLRTLELDPENVDALVGLAVLELNDENVPEGLELLKRAYQLDSSHPGVLNHLANHYFLRAQYAQTQALAGRAFRSSGSAAIRAEACYHNARAYHAQSDFQSALQWYTQASKECETFMPPIFGLGQMHLYNNEDEKAMACFEKVVATAPDDVDALKVLGMMYATHNRTDEALAKLRRVTELAPNDVGGWLELAKLHEGGANLRGALKAYEKAAQILRYAQRRLPIELYNNLGVLRHRLGKLESAEKAYDQAIKEAGAPSVTDPKVVTIAFNQARLWEEQGEGARAEARYREILAEHPSYLECFLRLSACAKARGVHAEAVKWAKFALDVDPMSADAWCTLGNLHVAAKAWGEADTCFKKVLTKCPMCTRDSYAQLALANIQVELAPLDSKKSSERLNKATELYRSVLAFEPNNVYAANGLGVVCVHKGRLQEAREIFAQVREASEGCDVALLNLAQLHAIQREQTTAVALFQKARRRMGPAGDAAVRLLEARTQLSGGLPADARRTLVRAAHAAPHDVLVWYNLCLVLARRAKGGGADGPRPIDEIESAAADVALARRLLAVVDASSGPARAKAEEAGLDAGRISGLRGKCDELGRALDKELKHAQERQKAESEHSRISLARLARQEAEEKAREAAEEAKRAEAAEHERMLIRQRKAKLEEKMSAWREEAAKEAEKEKERGEGRRGRKRKGATLGVDSDSEEEPATSGDAQLAILDAADEAQPDDSALFGSDESDDEAGGAGGAGAEAADADTEAAGEASASASAGARKKRRLVVDSDEDDDDDAGEGAGDGAGAGERDGEGAAAAEGAADGAVEGAEGAEMDVEG